MKHDFRVTLFLILLFFAAQITGLFLLLLSSDVVDGEVVYEDTPVGRPDLEGSGSFIYTLAMILVGTALLLLIIRLNLFKVWKAWFFFAIFGALFVAFSVAIPYLIAGALAAALTYWKLYRPNVIVHNLTEVFMYAGIAILIAPMFSVFWAVMLLLAISIYDAFAVWKSKHMVTMAKAMSENKMFAGLLVPYERQKKRTQIKVSVPKGIRKTGVKSAILGGGDIAFPLIFAGTVMTSIIEMSIQQGVPVDVARQSAFLQGLFISTTAGIALFLLFIKGKKDRFYPAMPFITLGCLVGYGLLFLI